MMKFWACLIFLFPAMAHAGALHFIETNPLAAVIGLALIILEFMLPTKGLLGLLGIVFFVLGTASLADYPNETLRMTWPEIIALNILVVGVALLVAYKTFRDYYAQPPEINDTLLNQQAIVVDWNEMHQRVEIGGAIWQARSNSAYSLQRGDKVTVIGQDNLTLIVSYLGEKI